MEMIIITVKTLQNKKAGHLTLLMKHTRHQATRPPPRHRHDKLLHINFLSSAKDKIAGDRTVTASGRGK